MYRRRLCEVALCLVTACGSFGEGSTSSSSSSGVVSPPASDASANETGGEDDAGDGGVPSSDAMVSDSSDGLMPDVCDDFERPALGDPRWTNIPPPELNSRIDISSAQSFSKDRSLLLDLEPSASDGRRAYLERKYATPAGRFKVTMKVFVEALPTSGHIFIAEMVSQTGNAYVALDAEGLFAQANLKAGGASGTIRSGSNLATGMWREVTFEYRAASTMITLRVAPNGTAQTAVPAGIGLVEKVQIGSAFAVAGTAAKFYIDDACFDRGF